MSTIFAMATAPGRAGVSVVRVSGPEARAVCLCLVGYLPEERRAEYAAIRGADGELIDDGLVMFFAGPRSFTGEDTVEFQIHGSTAIVNALLSEVGRIANCRPAEAGDFTRRAFQNGKLDLTQVEGLADLIEAETEAQRKQAQRTLSGDFSNWLEMVRARLYRAAALLEASIDFADEEVPEDVSQDVISLIDDLMVELQREINGQKVSERIRQGFEVAIVGPPNVGKSTLLNYLAARDVAITSDVAGTTRDVIEVQVELAGLPVSLLDTAGVRVDADGIELVGISRALDRAGEADLRVFLGVRDGDSLLDFWKSGDIRLSGKADIEPSAGPSVSGLTGDGVPELVSAIEASLSVRARSAGLATHERHRLAFEKMLNYLSVARSEVLVGSVSYDIAAEELRSSMRCVEALLGRFDVDRVLDVIFSSFCIGK